MDIKKLQQGTKAYWDMSRYYKNIRESVDALEDNDLDKEAVLAQLTDILDAVLVIANENDIDLDKELEDACW